MLVKIVEPKFTVFFHLRDITRITPVFVGGDVDCYALQLTNSAKVIKLSIQQLDRLIPFLEYLDLSIDFDDPEDITLLLNNKNFEATISELLDAAISSTSIRPMAG